MIVLIILSVHSKTCTGFNNFKTTLVESLNDKPSFAISTMRGTLKYIEDYIRRGLPVLLLNSHGSTFKSGQHLSDCQDLSALDLDEFISRYKREAARALLDGRCKNDCNLCFHAGFHEIHKQQKLLRAHDRKQKKLLRARNNKQKEQTIEEPTCCSRGISCIQQRCCNPKPNEEPGKGMLSCIQQRCCKRKPNEEPGRGMPMSLHNKIAEMEKMQKRRMIQEADEIDKQKRRKQLATYTYRTLTKEQKVELEELEKEEIEDMEIKEEEREHHNTMSKVLKLSEDVQTCRFRTSSCRNSRARGRIRSTSICFP